MNLSFFHTVMMLPIFLVKLLYSIFYSDFTENIRNCAMYQFDEKNPKIIVFDFFFRNKMFSNSGLEPKKGKFTNLNTFTENKILKESTSLISQRRNQLISSLTQQKSHLVNPILQKYETKLPSTTNNLTFQTKFTNLTNSQLNKP